MASIIDWIKENIPSDNRQSNKESPPQSAWAIANSLVPVSIVSTLYIAFFLVFRRSQRRFYAPRTYLGSLHERERSPDLGRGWFSWFRKFSKLPDAHALTCQGIDSYLFLRYLRIAFVINLFSLTVTWTILFPVNATGHNGQTQLELLSYSNINPDIEGRRFYAHALVGWVVYGFVMYMIMRECTFYINLRQAYSLSSHYSSRISSRTVLFTHVPREYLQEEKIRHLFNNSVRYVWITGNTKELDKLVKKRDHVAMRLESAEIKLLRLVNAARVGAAKQGHILPGIDTYRSEDVALAGVAGNLSSCWVSQIRRPSHRLGPLGLFGKKADTIDCSRNELQRIISDVEKMQTAWAAGNFEKTNAVFVEFMTQNDAQVAYQVLTHHRPFRMAPKFVGVKPDDIVWNNISVSWWQLLVRRSVAYTLIAVLVVSWAVPVAIIGLIAQVNTLQKLPGLTWIKSIPTPLLGFISGLLPALALSFLMSYVPIIIRGCAKLAGIPTLSRVELFTQSAYFMFQVTQVFLVRSIFDAASATTVRIVSDPSTVFKTLGQAIPTSSNFYISFFMLQGLTIATGVVTQVAGMAFFYISYRFISSTPRAMYRRWTTLSGILWGSLLPVFTNVICISVIYSVIAPFMLFWSSLAMGLFYVAYRYNILFVSESSVDTHGLIYPRALKQLFVGVYLAEVVMATMFAATRAAGPAVLMAIALVFSIIYHITLSRHLNPLLYGLPHSLQRRQQTTQSGIAPPTSPANAEDGIIRNMESSDGSTPAEVATCNIISRILRSWLFCNYEDSRSLMTIHDRNVDMTYSEEAERTAYQPPSVTSKAPPLWIPRDKAGLSRQEVALTGNIIPISDAGASLDEENNILWDTEGARPPIWKEKIYF